MGWSCAEIRGWWIRTGVAGWVGFALMTGAGDAAASPLVNEPILPVPLCTTMDGDKLRLGRRLYHDVRLSANNTVSCATCHPLERWGVDGQERSSRVDGVRDGLHTPTVFNALFNLAQFWNGRAATLEDQVDEVVRVQMGSDWNDVVRKLTQDADYRREFGRFYRGGIQAASIRDALAEFERSLITPNSRFDRHLRGDPQAITAEEKAGYALFKGLGCVSCHQGVNLGGNMYHHSGVFVGVGSGAAESAADEQDRFAVTGVPEDRRVFKVPGLRNVARTAPYFHDGRVATLEDAVTDMARSQLGRALAVGERDRLVAFLRTLDGALYGECP
ncbi:MAG: c-type cytochrome [Magnetococcales bacterium]|nr:c-type cytochrome [Magnetococcales bacterium]